MDFDLFLTSDMNYTLSKGSVHISLSSSYISLDLNMLFLML
jgi:hypothetical protein